MIKKKTLLKNFFEKESMESTEYRQNKLTTAVVKGNKTSRLDRNWTSKMLAHFISDKFKETIVFPWYGFSV